MDESNSDRPPRRERYQGKNPRRFSEKYKEHQPEKYADDITKILSHGRTPAGSHRPIMVSEILDCLTPRPGESICDCTVGYGGHAAVLLAAVQPGGKLFGFDVDPIELPKSEVRLRALGFPGESIVMRRSNFAGISQVLSVEVPQGVDMVLADLGVSSMQIDDPSRGFTFKVDGPLDMRMNPNRGVSASSLLSKLDDASFARLMDDNADEPNALMLARVILASHATRPIDSTLFLAELIRTTIHKQRRTKVDDATDTVRRVFQSLRIAVNDEFGALDTLLKQLPSCLKSGGRVAILTFHSGEDRRVKNAFKAGFLKQDYASISNEVTRSSMAEQRSNPRSASAKLRLATRS